MEYHRDFYPRESRACDQCAQRKTKCDQGAPACGACTKDRLVCTDHRPSRKRGPPISSSAPGNNKRRKVSSSSYDQRLPSGQEDPTQHISAAAEEQPLCVRPMLAALAPPLRELVPPIIALLNVEGDLSHSDRQLFESFLPLLDLVSARCAAVAAADAEKGGSQ